MEMCVHPQCAESMSSHRNRLRAKVRLRSDAAVAPLEPAFFAMKEARPQSEAGFFVRPGGGRIARSARRCVDRRIQPAGTQAIVHRRTSRTGFDVRAPAPPRRALAGDAGRTGGGMMRFPWNRPTGILFFTTRSRRFAAFSSGTRNHKSDIHELICSSNVIGPSDARRSARGQR